MGDSIEKGPFDPIHRSRRANKIPQVRIVEALLLTGHMINDASVLGREILFHSKTAVKSLKIETMLLIGIAVHFVMLSAKRFSILPHSFPYIAMLVLQQGHFLVPHNPPLYNL